MRYEKNKATGKWLEDNQQVPLKVTNKRIHSIKNNRNWYAILSNYVYNLRPIKFLRSIFSYQKYFVTIEFYKVGTKIIFEFTNV